MEIGYVPHSRTPDEPEYPYIVLGEQFSQNIRTSKDSLNKDTQVTLHVWHNDWDNRGTLTELMYDIEKGIIRTFGVRGDNISTQLVDDPNTNLIHGILETDIRV